MPATLFQNNCNFFHTTRRKWTLPNGSIKHSLGLRGAGAGCIAETSLLYFVQVLEVFFDAFQHYFSVNFATQYTSNCRTKDESSFLEFWRLFSMAGNMLMYMVAIQHSQTRSFTVHWHSLNFPSGLPETYSPPRILDMCLVEGLKISRVVSFFAELHRWVFQSLMIER